MPAFDDLAALSAHDLDRLLEALTRVRMAKAVPVAVEPPDEAPLTAADPHWRAMPLPHGTLLQLRHPALGWVSFMLPPLSRATLLGALLQQALGMPAGVPVQPALPLSSRTH